MTMFGSEIRLCLRALQATLLVASMVVDAGTAPSYEQLKAWAVLFDSLPAAKEELDSKSGAARDSELRSRASAVDHMDRLNAVLLTDPEHPTDAALLRELLDDPASLIRREAARKLFGKACDNAENVQRYAYANIPKAEARAQVVFESLPKLSLAEQYAATRELIQMGFDATLQIRGVLKSAEDPVVLLNALIVAHALQEKTRNIEPRWLYTLRDKLEKPITIEFVDTPAVEAFRTLAKLAGIPITVNENALGISPLTFRFQNMPARAVLGTLATISGSEIYFRNRRVEISGPPNLVCSVTVVSFCDARDLAAANRTEGIKEWIRTNNEFVRQSVFGTKFQYYEGVVIGEMLDSPLYMESLQKVVDDLRKANAR